MLFLTPGLSKDIRCHERRGHDMKTFICHYHYSSTFVSTADLRAFSGETMILLGDYAHMQGSNSIVMCSDQSYDVPKA